MRWTTAVCFRRGGGGGERGVQARCERLAEEECGWWVVMMLAGRLAYVGKAAAVSPDCISRLPGNLRPAFRLPLD